MSIEESGEGREKVQVLNYPMPFIGHTDPETKRLTRVYDPRIVHGSNDTRIGYAFPQDERGLEEVVHPIIGIASNLGEFCGIDEENHQVAVAFSNYCLESGGYSFRTITDLSAMQEAVLAGYLRIESLDGKIIYFPTEKAVRAMCNTRIENFDYAFGLHTGVSLVGGHLKLPDWAGE